MLKLIQKNIYFSYDTGLLYSGDLFYNIYGELFITNNNINYNVTDVDLIINNYSVHINEFVQYDVLKIITFKYISNNLYFKIKDNNELFNLISTTYKMKDIIQ